MSHKCRAPGCDVSVPHNRLMCLSHWGQVPEHLQQAVTITWNRGRGIFDDAYHSAVGAAITSLEPDVRYISDRDSSSSAE